MFMQVLPCEIAGYPIGWLSGRRSRDFRPQGARGLRSPENTDSVAESDPTPPFKLAVETPGCNRPEPGSSATATIVRFWRCCTEEAWKISTGSNNGF